MNVEKLKIMMNAFVFSQFSYCPLVCMFHDRSVNKKVNKINERALRIAVKDTCLIFEELLMKVNTVSIRQKIHSCLLLKFLKTQSKESQFKFHE